MKHYDSIPRIQDDGSLKGDIVWGFNKLDGQNFCVTFNCRKKTYGPYGSRNVTVDKDSDHLGPAVIWFDNSNYKERKKIDTPFPVSCSSLSFSFRSRSSNSKLFLYIRNNK